MKVVFLHGIGDGDPEGAWLDGLNSGLQTAGHPPVDESQVIAPRYDGFLRMRGLKATMPELTYKPKDDRQSRREFERRQADVQRLLQQEGNVAAFGFHKAPTAAAAVAQGIGVRYMPGFNLPMVRRYVNDEDCRGAILRFLLNHLPPKGDIVLIGHSLGSVIAIDLLDHLPEKLRVRRFITIGSPASSRDLHRGSARLLKKIPYSKVDDWTNFFSYGDHVPMGRGLASLFPGAQDFGIRLGPGVHGAKRYLAHPAVVKLVAKSLYPLKHPVPTRSDIAIRLTDEQYFILIKLHFARAVAKHIEDGDCQKRYTDALNLIQDDVAAQLQQMADTGQSLPPELRSIIAGQLPDLPHRLELNEAVILLTALTDTNFVEPYPIETDDASREALGDMMVKLGFARNRSAKIVTALAEVDKALKRNGIPFRRAGVAAAGLALLAAGPVGLAMAVPAGLAGGAAIVGGLAAFGPGGMVGGLGMLGGLAAGGAGVAAAAAFGGSSEDLFTLNVAQLRLRVAAAYALKLLYLPADTELWSRLTTLETQVSAELNRLGPFSDPKAVRLQQLRAAKDAVIKLLGFVVDKGIGGAVGI